MWWGKISRTVGSSFILVRGFQAINFKPKPSLMTDDIRSIPLSLLANNFTDGLTQISKGPPLFTSFPVHSLIAL